jgi:hypothetical protein
VALQRVLKPRLLAPTLIGSAVASAFRIDA